MNMFIKIKIFTLLIILFISTNLFSSSDDSLLKEAKELEDEFLADLAEIVNIDSPADYVEGINSIQEILSDMLEELGAEVKVMESPIGANQLTAVFSGGGKKSILLMAHIDTVYKRGTAKDRPFKIRKNQAFGPGINDNKSSAILGIYALMLLKKKNFNDYSKITFFINGDEEIGSPNSKETVMTLAMEHDYSLCIEGTSGSDSVASFRNKINERPAFHLNAGTDLLIKKAKKIYLEIEKKLYIQGGGGASDGNYSHEAGTPTLDSLGVVGGRSHSDEEYLDINSIAPRLYLLSRLLMDLGSNK